MKQMILLISIIAASLLGGCSNTTIKDLSSWKNVAMQRSISAYNTKALLATGDRIKIVVDKFVEPENQSVRQLASLANLSNVMAAVSEKYLTKAGVEVIDRKDAKRLLKEIRLAEAKGKAGRYKGPQVVQYALVGYVDGIDTSSKFTERKCSGGKCSSPTCTYTANIVGKIRIYTVPELRMVKSIALKDDATRYEETRTDTCMSRGAASYTTVIRDVGEQAVKGARIKFQNFFAPKAYVSNMRMKDGKYIIKINIGKNRNLEEGTVIKVFTTRLEKDGITGEEREEKMEIAAGKVTNQIGQDYAWVILDEPELASRIRIGFFVKAYFEKNGFEQVGGFLKTVVKRGKELVGD